ncbi:ATP-binding protein [Thermohalobacter berrensis]|uniref:histidine kinase n=1 Tax=Thermohalobacter berrensis TaxID=99594 RepID=A0A419T3Y8_9FIRM|nr:ATP-binding protein [Thermohalobacter berrensis]RKD32098.1 PAS domain-containing sensor histidine kinase [Thermohalobacter berrensis]
MFKSIRWKFIVVYFLLVFIAMVIVGVFIIEKFEEYHINQITDTMEERVKSIIKISSAIQSDSWEEVKEDIQNTIRQVPLGNTERLYIIINTDIPSIIASNNSKAVGENAYEFKALNSKLIIDALKGKKVDAILPSLDKLNGKDKHLAYPVYDEVGKIKGLLYITSDLTYVYDTIDESKSILTKATLLALFITVFLGFFIAKSITGPINDVTIKAEKMAKGDFNQKVEVKSDDEIGQLASMFNYLTEKLNKTLSEVYREKSKMDTIFTYMADGVIAVNTQGNILHANPIALSIFNLTYKDIESKKFDDIFSPLNEKITLQYLKKEGKWEGNELVEVGSEIYRAKYAPFKNDKNQIGGFIVVFQDVTEQQKLENMRKEFVANVSHELKTPITTIKSYAETLLNGAIEDRDLAIQFLSVINSECDRMGRIVKDLLQLSNLDFKQTKWKIKSLSLKKVLEDAYMKMKMAAEEKKQSLNLSVEENIPNIYADKDGIEQVILNIISNAIKYTPDKGKIDIIARKREDKAVITVKDNGIGIPKEDLKRIFERFYRVDKARSRALGGTGLGLSIAKQIAEAHNGDIKIRSEYNKGTEVDIILPVEDSV